MICTNVESSPLDNFSGVFVWGTDTLQESEGMEAEDDVHDSDVDEPMSEISSVGSVAGLDG